MTGLSSSAPETGFRWSESRKVTSEVWRALAAPALLPATTSVHPVAVAVPVASFAWLLFGAWIVFGGGETTLVLAVVTFLSLMFFGLLIGGGMFAEDTRPERPRQRSFAAFLDGDVDIETGRISGQTALWQISTMPVALAIGGTVILGCARAAGF